MTHKPHFLSVQHEELDPAVSKASSLVIFAAAQAAAFEAQRRCAAEHGNVALALYLSGAIAEARSYAAQGLHALTTLGIGR